MGAAHSISRSDARTLSYRRNSNNGFKRIKISGISAHEKRAEEIYDTILHCPSSFEFRDSISSLVEVCIKVLIRYDIPMIGLPREVIDKYVEMLEEYHAFSKSSLLSLKNCDVSSINLSGCRGVKDSWLQPFWEENELCHLFKLDFSNCRYLSASGICKMQSVNELYELSLRHCHLMTAEALNHFKCNSLINIDLSYIRNLSDSSISFIQQCDSLKILNLEGCHLITDQSMQYIKKLLKLEDLNLSQCHGISKRGLMPLNYLKALKYLNVGWCKSMCSKSNDSDTIPNIPHISSLRSLCLANWSIEDVSLMKICEYSKQIRYLNISQCGKITDRGLTFLRFPFLNSLDISRCHGIKSIPLHLLLEVSSLKMNELSLSVNDISKLSIESIKIEELQLAGCAISDRHLSHISLLTTLRMLNLRDVNLSSKGISNIQQMKKLVSLDLSFCFVSDENLVSFSLSLRSLAELYLDSRYVTDRGLKYVARIPSIIVLHLGCSSISDRGLKNSVSKLCGLRSFEVTNGIITCSGVDSLAPLLHLKHLNLSNNKKVLDKSVGSIAQFKNLRTLNLNRTGVTEQSLENLTKLNNLHTLSIYGCQFSRESIIRLAKSLPALNDIKI